MTVVDFCNQACEIQKIFIFKSNPYIFLPCFQRKQILMTSSIWAKNFKHTVKITKKTGTLASKRQTTSVGLMIVPIFRCVIKRQLIPHFAYFCTEAVFIVDANFNWDNYNLCRSSSARQGKISANIGNVLLKKMEIANESKSRQTLSLHFSVGLIGDFFSLQLYLTLHEKKI